MYETVPQELKDLPNWVGWKLETRDGKPTKVPYSRPGVRAASTNPQDWVNFNDVCNIISSKEKGIGFVFDGNGIVGIDLDHCFNLDGTIKHEFANVLSTLKSYTEISPSGNGLHVFIKCEEHPYYWKDEPTDEHPEGMEHFGRKKNDLEIYSKARYFTITGMKWNGCPLKIIEYTADVVRKICDQILGTRDEVKFTHTTPMSTQLSDEYILKIASHASNAHKFNNLWNGSKSEYNDDDSAADMALASILAFYSTDANQIERLMRQSGLKRAKWDNHNTYLKSLTIQKAIRECHTHYEPKSDGSVEEGKKTSDIFLENMKLKEVPIKGEEIIEVSDADLNVDADGRKKISESSELTRLPPFPGTNHPLFKGWMDIGIQISYSRPPFHYFALMGLCTMILGKRVRTVLSGKSIYSNMFIQLLGTSSVSGKSFAIDMTTDDGRFLPAIQNRSIEGTKTVGGEIPSQNIPLCKFMVQTNKLMEPRMVQDLAKINDNMIWYFDEAQTFYAGAANNNSSILPQLCLIYDSKTVKSKLSISKKKDNDNQDYEWACEKPFGTLIFAMTDDQFDKLASSEQSEGGFLPRFMFIYEQGGEVRENVDITSKQQIEINKLVDTAQDIASKICILKNDSISFKVCTRIEKWKVEETNKHLGVEYTERRIAIQRIFIQVYKMAMVLTMLDTNFVNTVVLKDKKPNGYIDPISIDLPEIWVEEAINIAEKYLLPRMICVLQKANDVNVKSDMSKIMKVIKSNGGALERNKIGKLTHIIKKQLDDALTSLQENEEICKVKTLENGHWIERYCLVK